MPTFIITGATSMIGIALCQHISSTEDNFVYAVCRENSSGLSKLPTKNNLKIIFSDFEHIDYVKDKIRSAEIFVNLGWANTDHAGRNNPLSQGNNVLYTKNAMKVASSKGCKVFVQAGSQAEYGDIDGLITEDSPCSPQTEYGKAKLMILEEGRSLNALDGIKYLHLRIFSVFGENDHPWTLIMTAIDKMLKNESLNLSSGNQLWNYLYANDCANLILSLSLNILKDSSFKSGIFNIASRDTRPLKDFIKSIYVVSSSKSNLAYGKFMPSHKVSLYPSIDKLINQIGGFEFTKFEEAIGNIIQTRK